MKTNFTCKRSFDIIARAFMIIHSNLPGFISMTFITSAIDSLKPLATLFFSSRIINELTDECDVQRILFYILAAAVSLIILSIIAALINQKLNIINNYSYSILDFICAKRYIEMDYPNTEDNKITQKLADIRANAFGNGLGLITIIRVFPVLVKNVVTLVVALTLLAGVFVSTSGYTEHWITSQYATIILIILIIISVMTPIFVSKIQKRALEVIRENIPKKNALFQYYDRYKGVDNAAKDIRLYNQASTISEIMSLRLNNKADIWYFRQIAATNCISGGVNALIGGVVYLFVGLRALCGMYMLGNVVLYVGAITNIIITMSSIMECIGLMKNNIPYLQAIYDFVDLEDPQSTEDKAIDKSNINIEFDNVSFIYPENTDDLQSGSANDSRRDKYALRNVNLRITNGQRLAVVGMNGSGKTTMIKLLCRLYKPTEGIIRLNGVDINTYSHAEYVRLFNVVFQDYTLFSLAIGANIATSNTYDSEKATESLVNADFDDKFKTLEKGLDTMIGKECDKEGVFFSGGEKQKIAIARSIFREAPFIIFDEPTAALDPISESQVYIKLNSIVGDKAAVFVSHRLSTCRLCDTVAVFHEGKLVQHGNHDALLEDTSGKYYELWNAQSQYYK